MRRNIIIGISLVFLLMIAAVYYFFLGGQEKLFSNTVSPTPTPTPTITARPSLLVPKAVSTQKVVSPVLSLTGGTVWYFTLAGELYRNKFDGSNEENFNLVDPQPIVETFWPKAGNDFIERLPSVSATSTAFRLYQAAAKKFVALKPNIQALGWLPDGKRIVYAWLTGEGKYELKLSNSDGSNFSKLTDLSGLYLVRAAPAGDFVLIFKSPQAGGSKIYKVGISDGKVAELVADGRNTNVSFSPDGAKFLFNKFSETTQAQNLWIYDFSLNKAVDLNIVGPVSKTVWAGADKFYFAVPDSALSGAEAEVVSNDSLFSYDLLTQKSTEVLSRKSEGKVDYRDMLLAQDGNALLYRDFSDGKLYFLQLK